MPGSPRRVRSTALSVAVAGACAMLAAGCLTARPPGPAGPSPGASPVDPVGRAPLSGPSAPGALAPLDDEARAWVERTAASLTLRDAVLQLVVRWIPGAYAATTSPEFEEAAQLVDDGIGGLYLSIGSPHAYAAKVNELQRRARVPLLFTSDFENGGPGMRINHVYSLPGLLPQGGGTSLPPTMAFGAIGDERFAFEYGRITAVEARAVGVALNFAPVLDVNDNPANPVINVRSFGGDPESVARLGAAFVRGSRAGGLMATAKHFPGHGNTQVDSHLALPVIEGSRERLDAVELVPFRRVVAEGVDAVMSAHIALPGVVGAGEPPATLHPYFMDRLLRGEMGFDGLVVTDALTMAAISEGSWGEAPAVMALLAGTDILLSPPDVGEAVDAVVAAVERGTLTEQRVRASTRRVLEAKARAGLHRNRFVSLEAVDDVVGSGPHRAFADTAASRSITLVRDQPGNVPVRASSVLSITFARDADRVAGRTFDTALREAGLDVLSVRLERDSDPAELARATRAVDDVGAVLLGVYLPASAGTGTTALPDGVRALLRYAQARTPTVLISLGNPWVIDAFPTAASYLVAWSGREVMQRAAARAVVGLETVSGNLPVELPPWHLIGWGLHREARSRVVLAPVSTDVSGAVEAGATREPRLPIPVPVSASPLEADPALLAMSPMWLAAVDSLLVGAVQGGVVPGAALAVGRSGGIVRLRGYGWLDRDRADAVSPTTLYDLASVTKVVGTTTAIMMLVDEGRLSLDDRVIRHLPGWDRGDPAKGGVTVRHLLLHRSGLSPFRRWFFDHAGRDEYRDLIYDEPLEAAPGQRTAYSDIGVMSLGLIVEAIEGETLDRVLRRRVFAPLGMAETDYLPRPDLLRRVAPTEVDTLWRGMHVRGVVHDENADAMGGVAGHAGLFSTALDLATFADMMLADGVARPCAPAPGNGAPCRRARADSVRLIQPGTVERFVRRYDASSSRGLGWDTPAGRSSAGDYFSAASFGHTGFTGTSIWVDPERDVYVVLLTNRVNPTRDNTGHVPLRRAVHDAVARAVLDRPAVRRADSPEASASAARKVPR